MKKRRRGDKSRLNQLATPAYQREIYLRPPLSQSTVEESIVMHDSFPSYRQQQRLPPQQTWSRRHPNLQAETIFRGSQTKPRVRNAPAHPHTRLTPYSALPPLQT